MNLCEFTGSDKIRAKWFNPRTGKYTTFGILSAEAHTLVPPTQGKGCDWVLVVEEAK